VSDRASAVSRDNLGFLLAKASQRWNELLAERFRAAGYPEVRPSFGSVLVPLVEEDGLRMGELAARARLSKQAMTTLVRTVEEAGLVTRVPDPADGRASLVRLTSKGAALRPVAERVLRELDELVSTALDDAELDRLVNALRKVVEL
jgi:DNA-binding MarR family transcriptional regulator